MSNKKPLSHGRFALGAAFISFLAALGASAGTPSPAVTVDLHSHLFMKEGLGTALDGEFENAPTSDAWTAQTDTKVTRTNLDATGLKIVVVSLYAHPILNEQHDLRRSVRTQIEEIEKYVAAHPGWTIAGSASEASAALRAGKRVFVLSLECAAGTLESEEDLRAFIDEGHIRIVTFLHLTPDEYGSPALQPGFQILSSPFDWFQSWLAQNRGEQGANVNPRGLTRSGKEMIKRLVDRKVWIDLAHSSDLAQTQIKAIVTPSQPILYTHTSLRSFFQGERQISIDQLADVKKSGGIIGLIPTADMLPSTDICAFAAEWTSAAKSLSPAQVMFGTDSNAPLRGLSAGCGGQALASGYYRADQLPALALALRTNGAPIARGRDTYTDAFIRAWAKVRP